MGNDRPSVHSHDSCSSFGVMIWTASGTFPVTTYGPSSDTTIFIVPASVDYAAAQDRPTRADGLQSANDFMPNGGDGRCARGSGRAPPDRCPASSHPAGKLVHVEIVAPGLDLAVTDLEGPHDRQLERLVRELEAVHPLGHHDRTIGCDVDDAERDALDAWRTRADERGDVVR